MSNPTRRSFSKVGRNFCILTILSSVLQNVALYTAAAVQPTLLQQDWSYFALITLPWYLLALPYCAILLRMQTTGVPPKHTPRVSSALQILPVSITIMYLGNIIGMVTSRVFGQIFGGEAENRVADLIGQTRTSTAVLFVVILAPIAEELLFRKFLIDAVYPYGEKTAVLLSGLMFGAFHGNLYQFFYAAGLGCVFAYVYCKTGRVRYTMMLHAFINFLGSVVAPKILSLVDQNALQSGDLTTLQNNLPGLAIYFLYVFLLLGAAIGGLIILCVRRRDIVFLRGSTKATVSEIFLNPGMIVYFLLMLISMITALF